MERAPDLISEIKRDAEQCLRFARRAYYLSNTVVWTVGASSLAAGVGGFLGLGVAAHLAALIPAAVVLVSNRLRLGARANWYYEKHMRLENLRRELEYEDAEVADVSEKYRQICSEMDTRFPSVDDSGFESQGFGMKRAK